jgi:hypothetical protein
MGPMGTFFFAFLSMPEQYLLNSQYIPLNEYIYSLEGDDWLTVGRDRIHLEPENDNVTVKDIQFVQREPSKEEGVLIFQYDLSNPTTLVKFICSPWVADLMHRRGIVLFDVFRESDRQNVLPDQSNLLKL